MFKSEEGWLHFLFANQEDHYYPGCAAKLDWSRYLYYQLKKSRYKGIFFIQDLRNGVLVRTEDQASAEIYRKKANRMFGMLVDAPYTLQSCGGKDVYQIAHRDCAELRDRIIRLIKEAEDHYAFIVPIDVYSKLYEDYVDRIALISTLSNDRQKSIFVVTASCAARDSLGYLTDKRGVFATYLGGSVENLLKWDHRFVWYDAMKRALKNSYNCWNQYRKKDIERLLQYGYLIENWTFDWERFNDYADFIYAWYHSASFASCYPKLFPPKERHSLDELERSLSDMTGAVWETMDREIAKLGKKRIGKQSLLHVIKQMYSINADTIQPVLDESFEQSMLSDIHVDELLWDCDSEELHVLMGRFDDVVQELQKPWNDGNSNPVMHSRTGMDEQTPLNYCAGMLSTLSNHGISSFLAVEKIVNMMEYTVRQGSIDDQKDGALFEKKIRCQKDIVKLSMEIAKLQQTKIKCEEQIRECEAEFRRMISTVKSQTAVDPAIRAVTVDMLLTAADQKKVVDLNSAKTAKQNLLADIKNRIVQYEKIIDQLENAFAKLSKNTMADVAQTLKEITEAVKYHTLEDLRIGRELDKAAEEYDITNDELHKYAEQTAQKQDYSEQCRVLIEEAMEKMETENPGERNRCLIAE